MSFYTPSRTSMESNDIPSRVWTSPIRQRVIGSTPSTYTVSYPGHETSQPTPSPGAFESPLCRPLASPTKQRPTATKDSTYSATFGQASGQADYAINKNRVVLPRALSPFRSTSSYADSYNTSQSQLPYSASNVPVTTPPPATPPPAAPSQTAVAAQPAPAPLSTPTPAPLNFGQVSTPQSRSSLNNDLRSPPSKRAYAGPTDHGDRSKSPMSTTKETYTALGAVPRAVSPRNIREEYQHQQQRYTGPADGGLRVGTPATTYVENYIPKTTPQHSNGSQERARSPRVNTGLQRSVSPLPFGVPQTEDSTYRSTYTQLSQRPPAHEYPDATRHFSPSRARSPLPSGGPTGSSSYATAYGTATAVSPRATTAVPSTPPPAYSASPQSASNRLISPRSADEIIPAGVPHLSVRPERPPATAIHHTSEYYENFTKPGHSGAASLPAAGDHSKMTRRVVEERPARSPSTGNLNTTYNRDFTTPKERSLLASTCSELTLNPAEAPTRADHRGGIASPVAVRRGASPSPYRAASPFGGDVSTSYSASFNDTVSPSRGASTRAAPESLPPAGRASNRAAQARTPPPTTMTSTYQETFRRTMGGGHTEKPAPVYATRRSMPLSSETTYSTEFGAKPMTGLTATFS